MDKESLEIIERYVRDGAAARERFFAEKSRELDRAARMIASSLAAGGKLMLCGNGGSAADAQHMAGEFVNRFLLDRRPLAALALTTDSSVISAIGNDFGYEQIFAKQILALGNRGDVLLAISTSGNSPNILQALAAAREKDMRSIGLTGGRGGAMAGQCDLLLNVEHACTPLVQETHLVAEHLLCLLCDHYL
ncbi:MAG: D-sedoheptulose 7-phosphate isomerase [Deltaproteobacteria bacterium]|jgi:D-sedoheptulose 7-phosphate isomerase|nr:D-sedoheptulose 7-phosphate isomerase [Deltaproteobacteria bacterium]